MSVKTANLAASLGIAIPHICLPRPEIDLSRWAVIACDQFTSQPEYWQQVESIVGQAPSALHLVLPEIYLEHPGKLSVENRISQINETMSQYLADGTLQQLEAGWIAIDRATPDHASRKGLILAIDLEHYDFTPGNHELIRATEGTVLDRIPPRLAIRRDAPLEFPHVQLLIDDPARTVIEPLLAAASSGSPLYATNLMQGGGHVRGWFVPADSLLLQTALDALSELESLSQHGLLFAVGDGNHSLATAKTHWENLRGQVAADHPARFALVEVINIHDQGLAFEPIHRVVFNCDPDYFIDEATRYFAEQEFSLVHCGSFGASEEAPDRQIIPMLCRDQHWEIWLDAPLHNLAAGSVQNFLDHLTAQTDCRIDYIHGEDVVRQLSDQGNIGLLLPPLDKNSFFSAIALEGVLPRKTFSMGEACEKRYYIEGRVIR